MRLPRLIGEGRALDMMMTGRAVEASEAYRIGLADRLVPTGTALQEAQKLAHELANFPQVALLTDRASTITQWGYTEAEAIDREIEGSMPAFESQFQAGAERFVAGVGRHGSFED